ncbi:MAG: flavin reductase family protein [Baekduiaceae bacterium]
MKRTAQLGGGTPGRSRTAGRARSGTPPNATTAGMAALTPTWRSTAPRRLRDAMGRFATGVTVITTADEGEGVHGMTANGVLSVSLDPPLVLVSLGRCRMAEILPRTGRYGISVLAADQQDVALHFAGQGHRTTAPAFTWDGGLPFLPGALAHIGCRVADVHPAGDHVLWIGRVKHMTHRDGDPLLFYAGRFTGLA